MSATLPAPVDPAAPVVASAEPRVKDALLVFACCFASAQVFGVLAGVATIASWIVTGYEPAGLEEVLQRYLSSPLLYLAAVVDGLLGVVIVWYFGCRRFGRSLLDGVDLRASPIGWMIGAPLLGAALAAAGLLLLPEESSSPIEQALEMPGGIVLVCAAALLAPFYEEIYYRGFMQPILRRALGRAASIAVITFWFGAAHVAAQFGAWSSLAYIFFGGFVMTVVRDVTKSTTPSMLLHAAYNATIVVAVVATVIGAD